jgi:hypothetical protein
MLTVEERLQRAHTAQGDELWNIIRDSHPQVIVNATLNRNLSEEMALYIAKNRNAPAEALGFLASDVRFKESLMLKLAICKNPKTPQRVTFSLLKFLRIFDLGNLTRDQAVPITVRQKIELMIAEKIPSLPSGVKIALSKCSNTNIVLALMERGDKGVISACLDSPVITEAHLCKIISRPTVKPAAIHAVVEHPKWSLRYDIKCALIRNYHTPMAHVIRFIPDLKTNDLRELYSCESLSASTKPYIFSELKTRGEKVDVPEEEIFELDEDDEITYLHDKLDEQG